jgi:DSF synthase
MVRHMLMVPRLSPTHDETVRPDAAPSAATDDVVGAIRATAGMLPQIDLEFEPAIRTLWITLKPEPKPVFTLACGESVLGVLRTIVDLWPDPNRSPVLFLAYRGVGPVYALGGDLDFYLECLASNDRAALEYYAHLAVDIMAMNASSLGRRVITIANIHGKALGGSIDPPRSCNIMVAEEKAQFGYPEVAFNHFPIAAVPILSRRIGIIGAQRILMSGQEYSAREFLEMGVVDEVVPQGTGEAVVRDYAARSLSSHSARVALFSEFCRHAGDLEQELAHSAKIWIDHILKLRPIDIAKLQRIAQLQDKMLSRLYRTQGAATATVAPAE